MYRAIVIFASLLVSLSVACEGARTASRQNSKDVTIAPSASSKLQAPQQETASADREVPVLRLIASPEKYDGQHVLVSALVSRRFEDDAAYMSEDDFRYGNTANAIWLNFDSPRDRDDSSDGHWCIAEGVFVANAHGHLDLFSGSLEHAHVRACSRNVRQLPTALVVAAPSLSASPKRPARHP
jgi:hypothetical protein